MKLYFTVEGNPTLEFTPTRMINGGFTGRSQELVQQHIEEVKKYGGKGPAYAPCFFPKELSLIQQNGIIYPLDEECTPEVEPVLLVAEDGWYITVGCDVVDYKVESFQTDKSKCLYPNVLSTEAWRYEDVKDHWDELILRAWIGPDHATLYQEGSVTKILPMETLVEKMIPHMEGGLIPGTIFSGGSVGFLFEGLPCMECFEFELYDPVLERSLSGKYNAIKMNWFID